MKLSKIILTFLILFAAGQVCAGQQLGAGQEAKTPLLIDEFGVLPCGDLLGRLDNFFVQIMDQPGDGASGQAVIYANENSLKEALAYEFGITNYVGFRKFPGDRISMVRIKREGPARVEFWVRPAGDNASVAKGELWKNVLSPDFKPFIFGIGESGDCPSINLKSYAGFLLANPHAQGNLAIYYRSLKAARKEADLVINVMEKSFDVPRKRLRVFYKKEGRMGSFGPLDPMIEFWLVPLVPLVSTKKK